MEYDLGYIRLYRKFSNNELWLEKRRFSKAEAWIDLLMMANWKEKDVLIGVQKMTIYSGQLLTSQKKLATRWNWNISSVHRFLKLLSAPEIDDKPYIKVMTYNKFTLITILKWGEDLSRKKKKKKAIKKSNQSEHEIVQAKLRSGIPLHDKRPLTGAEMKLIRLMKGEEKAEFLKLDETDQKKHLKKLTEAKK